MDCWDHTPSSKVLKYFGLLHLPSCSAIYQVFPNHSSCASPPFLPSRSHGAHAHPALIHYLLRAQQPPNLLRLCLFWLWPLTQTARALEFPHSEALIDFQSHPLSGFHLVSKHFSQEPSTPMKLFNQRLLKYTLLGFAPTPSFVLFRPLWILFYWLLTNPSVASIFFLRPRAAQHKGS